MQPIARDRSLLYVKDAATRLGVSTSTIRRHIRIGDLEAVRLGVNGRYRVRATALDDFLTPAHEEPR